MYVCMMFDNYNKYMYMYIVMPFWYNIVKPITNGGIGQVMSGFHQQKKSQVSGVSFGKHFGGWVQEPSDFGMFF